WIEPARSEHDIEVRCIGSSRGHQSSGVLDARFPQRLFLCSIAYQNQPVIGSEAFCFRGILLEDDKRRRPPRQFASCTAAHASRSTNNVVIAEPADVAFHLAFPENRTQLEF